jgi:Ca-activated chloride channel homolog
VKIYAATSLLLLAGFATAPGGGGSSETRTFPARPGDTVVVQNDHGRVRIRGTSDAQVTVTTRTTSASVGTDHVLVTARKSGDEILLHALFQNTPGESVDFEIDVPRFMNVVVSGADPEISVQNIDGYARVSSLTGSIAVEGLASSVSLMSDRGDIACRVRSQPVGDTRIETIHGRVGCELAPNLNLRVWARAGERLSWGDEAQGRANPLEKQIGSGGPLLYVSSLRGPVRVDVGQVPGAPELISHARPPQNPAPQQKQQAAEGGQPPAGKTLQRDPTYKVAVDWVMLNVSVRDRASNRSLSGLRREDFVVYEDGVEQSVGHFETTEVPFNLLLLLDVSGSTEWYLHLIKSASIDFTHQIKENDRIALAAFNTSLQFIQGFTSDRDQVSRAIDSLRSGGGTSFYDALDICAREYIQDAEGRKAIVVFTDGLDNRLDVGDGSRISFNRLFANIQEIDAIIYPIFLDTGAGQETAIGGRSRGSPGSRIEREANDKAREQLQMIADQTGGRMYSPRRVQDLRGVYSEIADDLRVQYRIGYSPTNTAHDGSWRSVQVKIRKRPDAVARTRKGYYARAAGRP